MSHLISLRRLRWCQVTFNERSFFGESTLDFFLKHQYEWICLPPHASLMAFEFKLPRARGRLFALWFILFGPFGLSGPGAFINAHKADTIILLGWTDKRIGNTSIIIDNWGTFKVHWNVVAACNYCSLKDASFGIIAHFISAKVIFYAHVSADETMRPDCNGSPSKWCHVRH